MREELDALEDNKLWYLIEHPHNRSALPIKWVSKTKLDTHSDLKRLKARLIACGNKQVFGTDYQHTFATVIDMSIVKVLLDLAAT